MHRTRVIYRGTDAKWHPAMLEGGFDTGVLILEDGSRWPLKIKVDPKMVKLFHATCNAENLRLGLGLPEKMPKDLEWEGEFEGFKYKVFKHGGESPYELHRFCIWCEDCKAWKSVGSRLQEKHLKALWKFKAIAEREM